MSLHTLSIQELTSCFKKGEVSAKEIVNHTFARIEKFEPQLDAFISLCKERALQKAEQLDLKKKQNLPLGRLAAVPVAIKDNINVQGEITTCGSKFLTNFRAPFNATVIDLLEKEDAIIVGKTNLDEFAMGSSTENSAFKMTKNPWKLNTVPGGSSGGSAAAVAARCTPLALGSDTGGSIRQPGSLCGIVGFKPTYGWVSRYGLVAFGSSLDQIGPLTRSVADNALAMEVMGKHCPFDSTSIPNERPPLLPELKKPVAGMTIGVPWQFLEDLEPEYKKSFEDSIRICKSLGMKVVDVDLSLLKYSVAIYYIVATAEASTNLARFDGIRYGVRSKAAKTLDEVYDLSRQEGFGPEVKRRIVLGTFVLSSGYQEAYHRKAQKVRALVIKQYKEAFEKCQLIATPTSPFSAFELGSIKDPLQMYLADIYTIGADLAGLPAMSLPSGFTQDGRPIGLQLTGPQLGEKVVFQGASAFEEATQFYKKIPELFV